MSQPHFVSITQYTGLVGDQALAVEKRAVWAALVDDIQGRVAAGNDGVPTGYTFFGGIVDSQVNIWGLAGFGVMSPQHQFFNRIKIENVTVS
jgi:hypothetical protein